MSNISTLAINAATFAKLPYDPQGSSIHLAVEQFGAVAGIRMNHIPYKGFTSCGASMAWAPDATLF